VVALVLLTATLAACGAGSATGPAPSRTTVPRRLALIPEPQARPGQRGATRGPQSSDISRQGDIQLSVIQGLLDGSPIFSGDFADPYVLHTPTALYAFATSTLASPYAKAANIPVIALAGGSDFTGHYLGDAIPKLPSWTVPDFQWGPSVWARPDGTYVLYYSTPATTYLACQAATKPAGCVKKTDGWGNAQCISRATSTNPAGPYVDDSTSAFICPADGGAIDPSIFVDNGSPWLLWKTDGDCCNLPSTISIQPLTPDGLAVAGPPTVLLGATQPWEGGIVEGPSMIESDGTYWLFYSANQWGTPDYGIGVARCATVTGPCTKPLDGAWLQSTPEERGPGGQEFFTSGGLVWMVHHVLAPGETGNAAERRIHVDLLAFEPGQVPHIAAPALSAALALDILYYGDPRVPAAPVPAYLWLSHRAPDALDHATDARVVAAGRQVCRGLVAGESVAAMIDRVEAGGFSEFDSDVMAISASEFLCPSRLPTGLRDLEQVLNNGSATT
jgi:hypothetical protein